MRFPPVAGSGQAAEQHVWQHSLGDIVSALTTQGLHIDFLHEFPYCPWPVVAGAELVERCSETHGYYARLDNPQLPLMFSLKATKPVSPKRVSAW